MIMSSDIFSVHRRGRQHQGGTGGGGRSHLSSPSYSVATTRRRSQSMWLTAASMRNARGQTEGAVRCPGGGGESRGCAWTTFDVFGSRD